MNLADIVVVNESRDEASAGDVTIFRSANAACAYLEHWWVEDGEGFAYTAAGERLTLGVNQDQGVFVANREPTANGRRLVDDWLRATATSLFLKRKQKDVGQQDVPVSTEGLITYLGFTG